MGLEAANKKLEAFSAAHHSASRWAHLGRSRSGERRDVLLYPAWLSIQFVQIRCIAFLKLAVREAVLLGALVPGVNKVPQRYRRLTRPLRVSPPVMPSFHRRTRDPKPLALWRFRVP